MKRTIKRTSLATCLMLSLMLSLLPAATFGTSVAAAPATPGKAKPQVQGAMLTYQPGANGTTNPIIATDEISIGSCPDPQKVPQTQPNTGHVFSGWSLDCAVETAMEHQLSETVTLNKDIVLGGTLYPASTPIAVGTVVPAGTQISEETILPPELLLVVKVTTDLMATANFTPQVHTITATAGDHGTITPSGAHTYSHGDNKTFTLTPDADYRIDSVILLTKPGTDEETSVPAHPTIQESGVGTLELVNIIQDMSIHVTFVEKPPATYTVTYNKNATAATGNIQGSPFTDIPSGQDHSILAATGIHYPGHTFKYWTGTTADTEPHYNPGDVVSITANLSLYAQWEETAAYDQDIQFFCNYTPTDQSRYAPAEQANQGKRSGDILAVAQNPVRAGYTFQGWFTARSGGTKVVLGTTPIPTPMLPAYYAQWKLNPASVKVTAFATSQTTLYVQSGKTIKLPYVPYTDKAGKQTITWQTSKPNLASVKLKTKTGTLTVTGIPPGKAITKAATLTIKTAKKQKGTAKLTLQALSGKKCTITIKVSKKAKKIAAKSLKIKGLPKAKKGTVTLTLAKAKKLKPLKAAFTKTATGAIVTWKTNKATVATIAPDGKLTAKRPGTVTLTLKVAGKSTKLKLKIK